MKDFEVSNEVYASSCVDNFTERNFRRGKERNKERDSHFQLDVTDTVQNRMEIGKHDT